MRYDVTILTTKPGLAGQALGKLRDNLPAGKNQLLGCWNCDIGTVNRIMLLHAINDEADLTATRARLVNNENPFGLGDLLVSWSSDTYELLPFVDPIKPGAYGAFYEVRTYHVRPAALPGMMEAWRPMLPARMKLSPLYGAMYSITGIVPQFMHIWPWPDLNTRFATRTKAVEQGIWPPPGGAERLLEMLVDIYVPAPFSPSR